MDQELTFTPSEFLKCVDFPIDDDVIALEANETLTINLTRVTIKPGVVITPPETTSVIIVDDDGRNFALLFLQCTVDSICHANFSLSHQT